MRTSFVALASPFKRPSRRSSAPGVGLDALAEFMDADGVPRRSENVTRRMLQRGVSIAKAAELREDEQAHTSHAQRQQEAARAQQEAARLVADMERRLSRNGALKTRAKRERLVAVAEADARVAERVALWYDQRYLSPREAAAADVTERNSARTPSRTNAFIDAEGNLRRRRASTAPGDGAMAAAAPEAAGGGLDALARPEMVVIETRA